MIERMYINSIQYPTVVHIVYIPRSCTCKMIRERKTDFENLISWCSQYESFMKNWLYLLNISVW